MKLFSLIQIIILGAIAEELKFGYQLEANNIQCFMQNLMEFHKCTVHVGRKDGASGLMIMVTDPKGKEIDRQMSSGKMVSEWEVKYQGPYQICIQNQNAANADIEVMIKSGEFSDERSQQITKQHLQPVEQHAAKVNAMVDQIRKELGSLVKQEMMLSDQNDSIKTRVIVFGIISVLIMGVSTYMQVKYLKNFFRYKKII